MEALLNSTRLSIGCVLETDKNYCQTSVFRLEVDFVLPLSQEQEEEQEPSPKSILL